METIQKVIHRADERGHADHGWLKANHSFSFASYYEPEKVHFGALRVLNDDIVAPKMGFGAHPHDNMEIVTIPLKGQLQHRDNTGNTGIILSGDVQIMSAGTGIVHAEMNPSHDQEVNLFQIWVFPKIRNIKPRYDQRSFQSADRKNRFQVLVSPDEKDDALWINQDAWFSMGDFVRGRSIDYNFHKEGNGAYIMVIEGEVEIDGEILQRRDAIGISGVSSIAIKAGTDISLLVIEVPMDFE